MAITALIEIDPSFRPPLEFSIEWAKQVAEKLMLIEFATLFADWIATTDQGDVTLPVQSKAFYAQMLRQPAIEKELRDYLGPITIYVDQSGQKH